MEMKMTEAQKNILLKTARVLFQEKGFEDVSIDEICAEAQVSRRTMNSYFDTKDQLIEQCLIEEDICLKQSISKVIKELDYIGNIRNIFFWHVDQVLLEKRRGLLFKVMDEKYHNSSINIFFQRHREWKCNLIEQQLRGLGIKNSRTYSIVFLNVMENLMVTLDGNIDYVAIWSLLEDFLIFGFLKKRSGFALNWVFFGR